MKKLMIATPAFNGQVDIEYAFSYARTIAYFEKKLPLVSMFRRSGSLLVAERNAILNAFMASDCTHLLCIDADMGWKPQDIEKLLSYEKDLIGVCYLSRPKECFIFRPINESYIDIEENGLIRVLAIPAGFLMISRRCLSIMMNYYPDLYFEGRNDGTKGYGLFNTMVKEKEFWGEDFAFCLRAIQAGISVWTDPTIELSHAGKRARLIDSLQNEERYEIPSTIY